MDRKIFYSWQSDLQLNKDRINTVIESALLEINQAENINSFIYQLDESTRGKPGSVNIVNSTFKKILESNIFIADVSLINFNDTNISKNVRLTPNPNVLIELGYAIGTLGYERIIMISDSSFNQQQYLPFDMRGNKIIFHDFSGESLIEFISEIKKSILEIEAWRHSENTIKNFVNGRVEIIFLNILNNFLRFLPSVYYSSKSGLSPQQFSKFISEKTQEEVEGLLLKEEVLGFVIFKSLQHFSKNVEDILMNNFLVNNLNRKGTSILLNLLQLLSKFDFFKLNGFEKVENNYTNNYIRYSIEDTVIPNEKFLIEFTPDEERIPISRGKFEFDFSEDELTSEMKVKKLDVKKIAECFIDLQRLYADWNSLIGKKIKTGNKKV